MTLFGVDLSDYDRSRGPVNVADMAADGISVLTHKATEGTTRRHRYTGATLAAARAAGIPYLGAYIVPRTPGNGGNDSIAAQVSYYLDYVTTAVPWWRDHPGWFWQIDLEHWSNSSGVYDAVQPRYAVEVSQRLEATGRPRILYAPRWAYGDTIGGSDPLWSSAYGSNPAVHYREAYTRAGGDKGSGWTPYSGRTPLIWQYGSRTTIGSQPTCDANAIRDESTFTALFTGDTMADRNFGYPALDRYTIGEKLNLVLLNYGPETPDFNGLAQATQSSSKAAGLTLEQVTALRQEFGQLAQRVDQLGATGGAVDLDALAAKVAPLVVDQLFERIRQLIPAGATPQQQS